MSTGTYLQGFSLRRLVSRGKHTREIVPPIWWSSPADTNIQRQNLMYAYPARRPNGAPIHGLPPRRASLIFLIEKSTNQSDILHKLSSATSSPSDTACLTLLQTIFPSLFILESKTSSIPEVRGSKARIPGMMGIMREILVRHRRCDYAREVWVLSSRSPLARGEGLQESSHSQVRSECFVCPEDMKLRRTGVSIRHLVLQTGYWSCHTRRRQPTGLTSAWVHEQKAWLIQDARRFITAKQHENISIHSLVQGISINDITWLTIPNSSRPNPQEALKRRRLVEDLVTWLFEGYLVPLLRVSSCFSESLMLIVRIHSMQLKQLLQSTRLFISLMKLGQQRLDLILNISNKTSYRN